MQTVTANGQKFEAYNVTGKVEDAGKNMETKISGHAQAGYGGARASIQSRTVVHDQFFLTTTRGRNIPSNCKTSTWPAAAATACRWYGW